MPARILLPASDAEQKRKRREQELVVLLLFLSSSLDAYSRQFISGTLTPETFLFYAMQTIRQSHYAAASLGVQQAGGVFYNAYSVAQRAAQSQQSFLAAFARDIAAGRYDARSEGGEGAKARRRRFDLYGDRLVGTANQAWCAALGVQEVLWVLGPNENHCPDCPREAAKGWRPANSLTFWPCSGSTACTVLCRCVLATRDGSEGFRRPESSRL